MSEIRPDSLEHRVLEVIVIAGEEHVLLGAADIAEVLEVPVGEVEQTLATLRRLGLIDGLDLGGPGAGETLA